MYIINMHYFYASVIRIAWPLVPHGGETGFHRSRDIIDYAFIVAFGKLHTKKGLHALAIEVKY